MFMRIKIKSKRKRQPTARLQKQIKKDIQNTFRKIGMKGVNNIKSEIKKRQLVDTGTMLESVKYKMTPQGVRFEVGADYAKYINKGVRKHQMVYLTKADRPISIDVANRIVAWATPKAMQEKKFIHPGFRRGKKFIDVAIARTRKDLKIEIKKIAPKIFKWA
jgi:hypothetical protein